MNATCSICRKVCDDAKHLPLYAFGSEGVVVCLPCRITLTEVVRGMRSACQRSKSRGAPNGYSGRGRGMTTLLDTRFKDNAKLCSNEQQRLVSDSGDCHGS